MNLNISTLLTIVLLCVKETLCRTAPLFSQSYSVSGSLYLPYAELLEPFDAWYDADDKQSRIDYYQGMVKTYQLGTKGQFGESVQIVPVTTETQRNVATCFKSAGSKDAPVAIQSILPDISNFTFVGSEIKNGYQCEVWRNVEIHFGRKNTYTIWIRWQKNFKSPSLAIPIPVRYEMKGYNSLIGSHYDHYYLDYENFTVAKPNPNVFKISDDVSCNGMDDINDNHFYNFNPMKEYIHGSNSHTDEAWEKYKEIHSKSYNNNEHDERKDIFRHNLRFIHSTNRKGLGYVLKVNHLADRHDDELRSLRGGIYSPSNGDGALPFPYDSSTLSKLAGDLPKDLDWRISGAVTPVKDQATCGSCWSFSSVGAVEGAYFLKTGQLVKFSEQALVDCTWGYGNNGCGGGSHTPSFQWIIKHGGIPTDEEYGYYLGQDGYCHTETVNLTAPVKGFVNVKSNDVDALRVALFNNGPVSVFIDASHKSFSFYSHGVYFEPDCKSDADSLDHVVLAVGYGTLKGEDYWLIKNSWSNHWGDQGYVLMSTKNNNCGVMTIPAYVTM